MPSYDILTENVNQAGYIIHANNEAEAIGRARERWSIPDDQPLYAFLRVENERTQETIDLAGVMHASGQRVYVAWQYASKSGDHVTAKRLESVFKMVNRCYVALATYADLIDADQHSERQRQAGTYTTYSKPTLNGGKNI